MVGYSERDSGRWCCRKSGEFLVRTDTNEINTLESGDDEVPRLALFAFFSSYSGPLPSHFSRSP